jgi:hypothetical protein
MLARTLGGPWPPTATLDSAARRKLVKVLGMLGSAHEGERLAATTMAEELRKQLGQDWANLLRKASRPAVMVVLVPRIAEDRPARRVS